MSFPTPVLLGADLNCYQLARLLHEDYGVTSHAFGRYRLGETTHSRIVRFCEIPDLWDEKTLLSVLEDFARSHPRALLFGCTDAYVRMIAKHRARLAQQYLIPYGDAHFFALASDKHAFGRALAAHDLPTPTTAALTQDTDLSAIPFPQVLKAADSSAYYAHPFPSMRKAYLVQDADAVRKVEAEIRGGGYTGAILLQDYIPGDDTAMYVANGYVDSNGCLRQLAIGHVLLQEHTPSGIGNPCAILTEPMPHLEALVKRVVDALPIRGLFNIDIRYDLRNRTYQILECNPRQGRSAYSTRAAGMSPIASAIDELVYGLPYRETVTPPHSGYWYSVPPSVVKRHLPQDLKKAVAACERAGHQAETLDYSFDLYKNPKRKRYLFLHRLSHHKKFYLYDRRRSVDL